MNCCKLNCKRLSNLNNFWRHNKYCGNYEKLKLLESWSQGRFDSLLYQMGGETWWYALEDEGFAILFFFMMKCGKLFFKDTMSRNFKHCSPWQKLSPKLNCSIIHISMSTDHCRIDLSGFKGSTKTLNFNQQMENSQVIWDVFCFSPFLFLSCHTTRKDMDSIFYINCTTVNLLTIYLLWNWVLFHFNCSKTKS